MTGTAPLVTLDRARSVRRRIQEYLGREERELGADPTLLAQEALNMSGLEFFERWLRYDDLPPPPAIALLFSMEWVEVEPSRAVLALEPAGWMFNPGGAVYGGGAPALPGTAFGAAGPTTF